MYTCQPFLRHRRPGSAGIFEDDTIISEDSRRSPKSSEDVRSLPNLHTVTKAKTALNLVPRSLVASEGEIFGLSGM